MELKVVWYKVRVTESQWHTLTKISKYPLPLTPGNQGGVLGEGEKSAEQMECTRKEIP